MPISVLIYTINSSVSANRSIFPATKTLALASNEVAPNFSPANTPSADMAILAVILEELNLIIAADVAVEIEPDTEALPALMIVAPTLTDEDVVIDVAAKTLTVAVTGATDIEPEIDASAFILITPSTETAADVEILAAPEIIVLPADEKGADENGTVEKLIYDPFIKSICYYSFNIIHTSPNFTGSLAIYIQGQANIHQT